MSQRVGLGLHKRCSICLKSILRQNTRLMLDMGDMGYGGYGDIRVMVWNYGTVEPRNNRPVKQTDRF